MKGGSRKITYLTMGTLSYLVGSLKVSNTHVVAGFSEITVVALFAPLLLRNDLFLFLSSLSLAVQGNAPQQKLDLRAVERFF